MVTNSLLLPTIMMPEEAATGAVTLSHTSPHSLEDVWPVGFSPKKQLCFRPSHPLSPTLSARLPLTFSGLAPFRKHNNNLKNLFSPSISRCSRTCPPACLSEYLDECLPACVCARLDVPWQAEALAAQAAEGR